MVIQTLTLGALATNCYIVSDGHGIAAVIDPADNADAIRHALARHQLTLGAVLLTHAHFDHMGALHELMKDSGCPIYCHRLEMPALTDGARNLSAVFGMPLAPVHSATVFDDGDTVSVGELRFETVHTPGHTPGSSCYVLQDVLFSGDTLFRESIGRTDFPGGDMSAMRTSLSRLLTLEGIARILPGHGEETTLAHEQQYNPYVR